MSAFISKELQKMLKTLRSLGVDVEEKGDGKHNKFKVTLNGQSFVWVCSKTPSDHRSPLNELSRLRRQLKERGLSDDKAHQIRFH